MRIYTAKVGTVPMLIQLRHRYALHKGDHVLYRQVSSRENRRGNLSSPQWIAMESWQSALVDEEYPFPHNSHNLLWLSKF